LVLILKTKMKDDLEDLQNIGKIIAKKLRDIGIKEKSDFLSQDPYEIFNKLKKKDPSLCRCALASIVGAKQKKKWPEIRIEATKKFKKKFPKTKFKNMC